MTKISIFVLLIVGACNNYHRPRIEHATVREFCLGAPDEGSFSQLNEITKEGGCKGIEELVLADKVFALEPGDTVQIIEAGAEKTRIKNLNDTFWIASKNLTSNFN